MLMKVNKLFRRANSEPLGIRVLGYKENSRIHERVNMLFSESFSI